jgi:hypothetical protein
MSLSLRYPRQRLQYHNTTILADGSSLSCGRVLQDCVGEYSEESNRGRRREEKAKTGFGTDLRGPISGPRERSLS